MSASKSFRKNYSIKALETTFDTFIKSNTAIGIDKITYKHISNRKPETFNLINKKVLDGTYNFTPYKEKLILKSRNSLPRLISIPSIKDKVTLKALNLMLSETYNGIRQPLPQECIELVKSNINKYERFIKLDITNFYGNIRHGILMDILKKKIKKNEVLSLIEKAITTPTVANGDLRSKEIITQGVPQGLSISNILAHIYLHALDSKFKDRSDLIYIRYVDDIIILCSKDKEDNVYKEIKYELEGIYNLTLNQDKEKRGSIKDDGFDFLGYAVKDFGHSKIKLTIREANKKRFENSIVKIFAKYRHSNKMSPEQFIFTLNNKITGSISTKINGDKDKEFRYGWLFYFSQMEDTGFLYHLDWFIKELLVKFELSHINENQIKSFVKAFYEIKYNVKNSLYIHRPDDLNIYQRKQLLINIYKIPKSSLNNLNTVDKLYKKLVYKPIEEYEKDIHSIIS